MRNTARILRQDQDYIYWSLISDRRYEKLEVEEAQLMAGYHPMGYGGPMELRVEALPDGSYNHFWKCNRVCG